MSDVVLTIADGRIVSISEASAHVGPIDVTLAPDTVLVIDDADKTALTTEPPDRFNR